MCPCTCITVALQLVSCFQIVQAFSRLVAAGDDWASATEVVLLAAVALQHDLPQADSHAMVMASSFMCSLSAKNDAFVPFIACLAVHTADCMLTLANAFQLYHVTDVTPCVRSLSCKAKDSGG